MYEFHRGRSRNSLSSGEEQWTEIMAELASRVCSKTPNSDLSAGGHVHMELESSHWTQGWPGDCSSAKSGRLNVC